MFPLAQLKKIFAQIYSSLLQIIWNELIFGKKIDDEVTNLVLFVIFCVLSLASYYGQNYVETIIIILAIFWNIDYYIAQNQFMAMKPNIQVSLEGTNVIDYKLKLSKNNIQEYQIDLQQIKYINLKQREIEKGAFQEKIGKIWQMSLINYDQSIYLIDEAKNLSDILQSAQILKNQLNIPIVFADSLGNNDYAAGYLSNETWHKPNNIKCRHHNNKWHIYSQWNFQNFWLWLQQILAESGFFLFVLIMSTFMIKFGTWVEFFLSSFLNIQFPILNIYTPQEWFNPELDLKDGIELTIAMWLMVYRGWQISRKKQIYIDKYFCKFVTGGKQIAQFATKQIESILLLNKPQLEILIFDQKKYLILNDFQKKEELQEMVYHLESAIDSLSRAC
jgi:hypothetical protein